MRCRQCDLVNEHSYVCPVYLAWAKLRWVTVIESPLLQVAIIKGRLAYALFYDVDEKRYVVEHLNSEDLFEMDPSNFGDLQTLRAAKAALTQRLKVINDDDLPF